MSELKVGIELEYHFKVELNLDYDDQNEYRDEVTHPSFSVKSDGSLYGGGIELVLTEPQSYNDYENTIITPFKQVVGQLKDIFTPITEREEHAGLHIHLDREYYESKSSTFECKVAAFVEHLATNKQMYNPLLKKLAGRALNRWTSECSSKWKYSWVHRHDRYPTYEFRGFHTTMNPRRLRQRIELSKLILDGLVNGNGWRDIYNLYKSNPLLYPKIKGLGSTLKAFAVVEKSIMEPQLACV